LQRHDKTPKLFFKIRFFYIKFDHPTPFFCLSPKTYIFFDNDRQSRRRILCKLKRKYFEEVPEEEDKSINLIWRKRADRGRFKKKEGIKRGIKRE
jgi:hypothetical protein